MSDMHDRKRKSGSKAGPRQNSGQRSGENGSQRPRQVSGQRTNTAAGARASAGQVSVDADKEEHAKISLKPATLLSPVPAVLISCRGKDEASRPNLITLAWAGTICSEPPMVSISIRPSRFSHQMVSETGEFVINLVNEPLVKATDFCGVKSGRDLDKFQECGLRPISMEGLDYAPAVAESPLSLGCKVRAVQHYESHDVFQGEIVSMLADASLMDESGKLSLNRCGLVAYAHGEYFALGRLLGFYGYSVASDEVLARRLPGFRRRK